MSKTQDATVHPWIGYCETCRRPVHWTGRKDQPCGFCGRRVLEAHRRVEAGKERERA